jgi:formate dehydrogenase major subunit
MPEHPVSEGSLCPKGNAVLEVLNHPDRLQYPMKKTNGGWERISWDEALDLMAERLRSIRDSHVPRSARKRPSPLRRQLR